MVLRHWFGWLKYFAHFSISLFLHVSDKVLLGLLLMKSRCMTGHISLSLFFTTNLAFDNNFWAFFKVIHHLSFLCWLLAETTRYFDFRDDFPGDSGSSKIEFVFSTTWTVSKLLGSICDALLAEDLSAA